MISSRDRTDLERAKALLEKDSAAVKLARRFGDLAESIVRRFPQKCQRQVQDACLVGLEKSWEFSLTTLAEPDVPPESKEQHRWYAILSGAVGGVGIATLFAELPVTTIIMLRAVADIAKSEGEDFYHFNTKIACLQVFALGDDDFAKSSLHTTGYYTSRDLLAQPFDQSAQYIAKKGAAGMGAPFAVQLIAKIIAHYQTWVSARTAAAAIPIAGAVMGAGINVIYLNYLHDKAQGHFIIRRLERKYGPDLVKQEYITVQYRDSDTTMICFQPDKEDVDRIVRRHVYAAMGGGLFPVPLVDFLLILGIQLNMLRKISSLYHLPFAKNRVKNLLGALIGGTFSSSCGIQLGARIAKIIPVLGQTAAVATVCTSAGASTYAIGKIFNRHFAQGGTFLSFDPKEAATFYQKMFTEGTNMLRNSARL
ncbi:MAG: DUF697 domain-containing protein [Candidatus Electrothrix sp. AW5]|nr:DUF697 domain-containing protein [Candidatus Electrothrix gigas]